MHAQVEKFNEEKVNAFNEVFFEATKKKLTENNESAIELLEQSLNMAPTEAKSQVHHEISRLFHLI